MHKLPRRRLLDRLGSTPSLIAQHTRLVGDIETEGALLLNGTVQGNGRIGGEVSISSDAQWEGDVHAFYQRWLDMPDLYFHHLASFWAERHRPNLLLVHYNDLKADLAGEMGRVAAFLGTDVPEHAWPEVVARCTFERMREGEARMGKVDMIFKGGLKTFVFKGTNGRWRDVLTADELAAYDRRVAAAFTPECAAWVEQGKRALAR